MHYTADDFNQAPLMFYYEVTQACDLICKHCRASAQADPDPGELASDQSLALIDQVTTFPATADHGDDRWRSARNVLTCLT